jgi:hypothetical protein
MPWIDSLDWESLNALRKYPIREGLSAISADGLFSIPDTLIVDFSLTATSDVARKFYVSKVFNALSSVVIEISDTANNVIVGTVSVSKATHTTNKDYYMVATSNYVAANGKMTIGTLNDLIYQPAGEFKFLVTTTEFEPRTIIPGLQGIDRIEFIDELNGIRSLTGDVMLTARSNVQFSFNLSVNEVFLDAGDNLGLSKQCTVNTCIKSINGVAPDKATGNVNLIGKDCVKLSSSAQYTLSLEDTCCTPCSGCSDLEELTGRLTSLENNFLDLKTGYNGVNSQLTTYLSTINSNCSC